MSLWGENLPKMAESYVSGEEVNSLQFSILIPSMRRIGPHNIDLLSILIGSLLGDSYLEKHGKGSRFCFQQEHSNSSYLLWLHNELSLRGYCNPKIPEIKSRIVQESQWTFKNLATVITNLFSAIPWIGTDLVNLIWGLHQNGSNNPLGVSSNCDKIPLHPYFSYKDYLVEPDNYIPANSLVTPAAMKLVICNKSSKIDIDTENTKKNVIKDYKYNSEFINNFKLLINGFFQAEGHIGGYFETKLKFRPIIFLSQNASEENLYYLTTGPEKSISFSDQKIQKIYLLAYNLVDNCQRKIPIKENLLKNFNLILIPEDYKETEEVNSTYVNNIDISFLFFIAWSVNLPSLFKIKPKRKIFYFENQSDLSKEKAFNSAMEYKNKQINLWIKINNLK
ncbi:hypothetical protein BB561_000010 [Smittium simulii]|uniref:Homing endonuclease LAGLIDADG domain-containing protein n=1 Tax=Smittium simulii TaxID=133385 RepID=A0A2T9Z103_9FUNG|nr:hypothetical protein BB561_000010 [Smittium simulii]